MKSFDGRIGNEAAILYVNVEWCGHCKRTRPVMEKLSQHLGMSLPVIDVDGDTWGDYLQRVMGPGAPSSYPTILYVENGRATSFEDERTFRNLTDFACTMAGTCHHSE